MADEIERLEDQEMPELRLDDVEDEDPQDLGPDQQIQVVADIHQPVQPAAQAQAAAAAAQPRPDPAPGARRRLLPEPNDWGRQIAAMQREMTTAVGILTEAMELHRDTTDTQIQEFQDYLEKMDRDQDRREANQNRRHHELLQRLQSDPREASAVASQETRSLPETPEKNTSAFQPIEKPSTADSTEARRPGPTASLPMGRLDTYDGTTPWLEYQTYFEEYADYCRWTDPDKARFLCLQLRGGAQSVLVGLGQEERRDYEKVVHALRQHFCPAEKVYTYQAELQARRLQPAESLTDLAREIQCKARLAYPEAGTVTLESLMRSHFCNSLTNREMKISVSQGHPRTLTQALALAVEYESIILADEARAAQTTSKKGRSTRVETEQSSSDTAEPPPEDWKGAVERLTSLVQSLKDTPRDGQPYGRRRSRRDEICFNCGKPGHYARECWGRRKPDWPVSARQTKEATKPGAQTPTEERPRPKRPDTGASTPTTQPAATPEPRQPIPKPENEQ